MTDGAAMPGGADTPQTTEVATLLREVARLVDEIEALVAGSPRPATPSAPAIAAQQAAIVASAHEEAAAVLAAAHATAARLLDRASRGAATPEDAPPAVEAVVDLRDAALEGAPPNDSPAAEPAPPPPSAAAAPLVDEAPTPRDPVPVPDPVPDAGDADLRSSLAAAIEMARGLSERIEQLTREIHESSTP